MNNENQVPELPKMNEETNNQVITPATQAVVQTQVAPTNTVSKPKLKEKHSFKEFFVDLKDYVSKKNSNDTFELTWNFLLIAILSFALQSPFLLIKQNGMDLLVDLGISYGDDFRKIWNAGFTILYVIVALLFFYLLVKARFYYIKSVKDASDNNIN